MRIAFWSSVVFFWIVVMLCAGYRTAHSQGVDLCTTPLPYQADPGFVTKFRQQCTIQNLFQALQEAESRRIAAQVEASVDEAHARTLADERAPTAEYWKQYVAGLRFTPELGEAVDAVCGWHGTLNEPTARMCKLWKRK
jgi:hypothetical protein